MFWHPSAVPGGEAWVSLFSSWIGDLVLVKYRCPPIVVIELIHADSSAEFFRQFVQGGVALTKQEIAGSFCGRRVNANSAPTHFMHHRQQIDLEPIGGACSFLIENWIEIFEQFERTDGVCFGVWLHITGR